MLQEFSFKRMPQKRTKEQKRKAQEKRVVITPFESNAQDENQSSKTMAYSFVAKNRTTDPLLTELTNSGITQEYVKKDLLKTLVVSVLLGCILVGIYFRMSYN